MESCKITFGMKVCKDLRCANVVPSVVSDGWTVETDGEGEARKQAEKRKKAA
jgi:hypothetical protein